VTADASTFASTSGSAATVRSCRRRIASHPAMASPIVPTTTQNASSGPGRNNASMINNRPGSADVNTTNSSGTLVDLINGTSTVTR